MRSINEIIVHCTATPAGANFIVEDIDRWHRRMRYRCIGYHYVIYLDGSVHEGRPVSDVGAHCYGHNRHSIGVCYVGGVAEDGHTPSDTRTPEQKKTMRQLLCALRRQYPKATIHGHRDFANKACPSFDATKEYADIP